MPRVRAAYMTFSSICSNAALAFLYMRGSAMMVAATTQPSHVCTTCIPMLWLKKLPKGRLVLKILKRMYPATVGGSTIGSVSSPSQNALTLPFVFMTSSAKAIPIKKRKKLTLLFLFLMLPKAVKNQSVPLFIYRKMIFLKY